MMKRISGGKFAMLLEGSEAEAIFSIQMDRKRWKKKERRGFKISKTRFVLPRIEDVKQREDCSFEIFFFLFFSPHVKIPKEEMMKFCLAFENDTSLVRVSMGGGGGYTPGIHKQISWGFFFFFLLFLLLVVIVQLLNGRTLCALMS
jgi:hypothetical protein